MVYAVNNQDIRSRKDPVSPQGPIPRMLALRTFFDPMLSQLAYIVRTTAAFLYLRNKIGSQLFKMGLIRES